MTCVQKGTLVSPKDIVRSTWLFTAHSDQRCHPGMGPRNISVGHSSPNSTFLAGVKMNRMEHNHWLILENVKPSDQGRYCCGILEISGAHKHGLVQNAWTHVILHVIPRKYVKRCECALRLYWICPEMPLINIFCKKLRSWCCACAEQWNCFDTSENWFIYLFPARKGFQNCTVWDPTPTASMKHYSGLQLINVWGSYSVMLFNSQPVCCFPRLCASGLGYNSLHRGSAVPASYSSARVQTEGEFTVRKTYVLLMCTNSYTHTHT